MVRILYSILLSLFLISGVYAERNPPNDASLSIDSKVPSDPATDTKLDEVITELQVMGVLDASNSRTTILGIGATFTGEWVDISKYSSIVVNTFTDQVSAADGLEIQSSTDGVNPVHIHKFTVPINNTDGTHYVFTRVLQYYRIVYTNGGVQQGVFNLSSMLNKDDLTHSHTHPIDYTIDGTHEAQLGRNIIAGKKPNGDYVNAEFTAGGVQKFSLEELESGVSSNSNSQLNTTLFGATGYEAEVDAVSGSLIGIDFEHHECHEEDCYFSSFGNDTAGVGEQTCIAFTTAASGDRIHIVMDASAGLESFASIYENTSIDVDEGTEQNPFNRFRGSANTSQVLSIETSPVANTVTTYNETQAAGANITITTEIFHEHIGVSGNPSVRSGGASRGRSEYILDRSTQYAFCITAIDGNAQHHNVRLNYYEHTDSN